MNFKPTADEIKNIINLQGVSFIEVRVEGEDQDQINHYWKILFVDPLEKNILGHEALKVFEFYACDSSPMFNSDDVYVHEESRELAEFLLDLSDMMRAHYPKSMKWNDALTVEYLVKDGKLIVQRKIHQIENDLEETA